MKKITLLCFALTVCLSLSAQNGTDEPCNATTLLVQTNCNLIDTTQGAINPPIFTNSTSASSGVTLPALTCNGFTTTTLDCWYRFVVPASGKAVISVDFGDAATGSNFWDMAVYASSSPTCAGSTFSLIGSECVTGPFPHIALTGQTAGATIYIRIWRNAASVQTIARSFGIFVADGGIAQPLTCATPVFPITVGTPLTDDPFLIWNNDNKTTSYDLYYGATSTIASMNVVADNTVSVPYAAQEGFLLPHAVLDAGGLPVVIVQPNVTNYWFVHQKNCATDPNLVPTCTPSSYTAAPIPANDNCAGAILLSEAGVAKTHTSASSTESQVAVTCAGFASATASDVWFKFKTTAAGGNVTVTFSPSGILDGVVEAFSGTCGALTSIKCADATLSGDDEILSLTGLAPNTTYYVRVFNYNDNILYGEEFDITVTGNVAIPVELVAFTGKTEGPKNALNWHTASERNAQSFIVERSADGEKGFVAMGTLKAAGTTSTPQYYSFFDENPMPVSYYRLRQVDFDGQETVSKIISVQRKDKKLTLDKAFPSPVTNELTLQYSTERTGEVSLRLVDVFGRLVLEQNIMATEGGNLSKLAMDKLSAGTYILMLSDGQKTAQMRLIKQ